MEMCVRRLAQSRVFVALILMLAVFPCTAQQPVSSAQRDAAFALEQQGRTSDAETAWRTILKSHPADAEAWAHLGFLESRQEHYSQAVIFYQRAASLDPTMPGLQLNLGLALFKAGDLKPAICIFEPLLKAAPPGSPEAQRLRILLGIAYYGLGDDAVAIPWLKDAMERDPQNLPYRLLLANSCLRAKQYQCVLKVDREILALNPDSAEADMLAGEALDAMQDHAGAIEQFRAAVLADPRLPEAHFGLGYLLWCQSQYEDAAQQFQDELGNVPGDAEALTYLADSERQLNHPEIARPLIDKVIQMNPRNEMAYLDLGILDAEAGHNEDALREFKTAARLDPDAVQVHYRLARLYKTMGRKQQAQAEFDLTRKLNKTADESVSTKLRAARASNRHLDAPFTTP